MDDAPSGGAPTGEDRLLRWCMEELEDAPQEQVEWDPDDSRCTGRSLSTHMPDLARWWGPENLSRPDDWDPDAEVYVWWVCPRGHHFERWLPEMVRHWDQPHGGCYLCQRASDGRRITDAISNLAASHPDLAAEWSPRNPLGPEHFDGLSGDSVWWRCPQGHPDYRCSIDERAGIHYVSALQMFRLVEPLGCPLCEDWGTVILRRKQRAREMRSLGVRPEVRATMKWMENPVIPRDDDEQESE